MAVLDFRNQLGGKISLPVARAVGVNNAVKITVMAFVKTKWDVDI